MAKPELGTKRICVSCNARFYDLNSEPAICPKCGTEQPPEAPRLRRISGTLPTEQTSSSDDQTDTDIDVDIDPDSDDTSDDSLIEDTSDLDDDSDAIGTEIEVISDKDDNDN